MSTPTTVTTATTAEAVGWFQHRSADEIEAAECYKNLAEFVKRGWREIDPIPLVWNWHMDAICNHLQAVTDGLIQRLIINVPPGHSKSMLVSVFWPAWTWARQPGWKYMSSAHSMNLVSRDMVKARTLMASEWYQRWFRSAESPFKKVQPWDFASDQNVKTFFRNTKMGEATGLSVGQGTGKRGDALIIDDPIEADDAHSKLKRDKVIRWKTQTMSTRFNNLAKAQQVLIMQRLHEEDLTGYLLKNEPGQWEHLCLMSEFVPERRSRTSIFVDPRKTPGELLFPALFPKTELMRLKGGDVKTGLGGLGSYGYAGQHQQEPAPAEGGILKREYFSHRWLRPGEKPVEGMDCVNLPLQFDGYFMFTDAAFKATETSDFVAIGLFGLKGNKLYLLDLCWERLTFTETVQAILDMRSKWTRPPHIVVHGVYVEDKANGTAVMNVLKGKVPGLIEMQPQGGKEARIIASSPAWEAGNIYLPLTHPKMADFITEATSFPKASHDDAIDMCAYAIDRLLGEFSQAIMDALSAI